MKQIDIPWNIFYLSNIFMLIFHFFNLIKRKIQIYRISLLFEFKKYNYFLYIESTVLTKLNSKDNSHSIIPIYPLPRNQYVTVKGKS